MKKYTFGQKCADLVAKFGGSWLFIFIFAFFLGGWTCYNLLSHHPFDPYPFIFLNLLLSMLAAVQAPFIMMSNNRQVELDREKAEEDYEIDKLNKKMLEEVLKILNNKKEF
jgi:hypothetical protein